MRNKLLLFALLSFFSYIANAYDFESNGIYYKVTSNNTCAVVNTGEDNSYSGDIVIPEKVNYNEKEYTVTSIGANEFHVEDEAFKNCIKLKAISLPNTIKYISYSSFEGCIMLKQITIPSKVTELPSYTFNGCISLEKIDLGNVQTIGSLCFKGCVSLENISIPTSTMEIKSGGFEGCTSLSSLTIEDGNSILTLAYDDHGGLFADCPLNNVYLGRNLSYTSADNYSSPFASSKTISSVFIGGQVTKIDKKLFYKCTKLENISGMKNVEAIGEEAFYNCINLKKFIIENNVKKIGDRLLYGCTNLETLIIGDGIEKLGGNYGGIIIEGCSRLKNIYIGKGIKEIGRQAFCSDYGSTSWTKLNIANANIYLFSDNLSSNYTYTITGTYGNGNVNGGIPTNANAIYVANPERYETLLGKYYNLKPLLTFKESSLEYTGKTPALSYQNNVEGMNVEFDNSTTPKDVGTYNTNVDVIFSNEDYSTSVEIPCEYTITKVPLSIIAEDTHRSYKEENPQFTCSYIGFKNEETSQVLDVQPTVYTTANIESNAGTYPIYCSGAEARNYELNYKQGTLTIDKVDQEITWEQEFNNVAVGDNIELTATSSSGLPVKYRSTDLSSVMVSTKNGKSYAYIIKPGTVVLTAYQNGNNNYNEADDVNKFVNATATGIDSITDDNQANNIYYNLNGQQIDKPTKGVFIVKNKGKVYKVLNK